MARKKKCELPSGNVRIQIYDYTDNLGKKHYKSFTAPTRAEAVLLANDWKTNRKELKEPLNVLTACQRYIKLKEGVLSPSTVTGYKTALNRISKHRIAKIDLSSINTQDVQLFVSDLAASVSPKTVSNTYGLLVSALKVFLPSMSFKVTLPKKQKVALYIPSTSDVQTLLDACKTIELKLAILFAAIGTMRRGEACAVTFKDVDYKNEMIVINKSLVKVNDKDFVEKPPKTYESNRKVKMPSYVFAMIKSLHKKDGYVLGMNPDQLYDKFALTLKKTSLPHFRYHDLRHYAASNMHANGVPERYIEAIGGWKPNSGVLKRTYENVIDSELYKIEQLLAENLSFVV